jgi:hypothetical protein
MRWRRHRRLDRLFLELPRGVQSIVIERIGLACAAFGKAQPSPRSRLSITQEGPEPSRDAQGQLAFVEKEKT